MKRSLLWMLVLSIVIVGLLSGPCMAAATQSGENAKTVVSKTAKISTSVASEVLQLGLGSQYTRYQ